MRDLRLFGRVIGYISAALAACALLPAGCPSESGGVVDGQTVAEAGADCWDANGDGVNDPSEDVNADGVFDSNDCQGADGQNGANGPAGADGVDGFNGAQGASGLQGSPGSDGANGAAGQQGPPGPIDTTQPTAVTSLLVRRSPLGPPFYDLAWDYIGAGVALSHFNVYVSSAAISSGNKAAALWSSATASERTAPLWIPADSGQCYIRVTAVSYAGVESALSYEKVVDTTSRVVFLADITNDGSFELFEGTPSGATPVSLSGPLAAAQSISTNNVIPSPDGLRVAWWLTRTRTRCRNCT